MDRNQIKGALGTAEAEILKLEESLGDKFIGVAIVVVETQKMQRQIIKH
jgi:hypothetical protein